MGKCSLQVLEISENNIGDDGIAAISRALWNSQISELNLSDCGVTLSGAKSLAAGLLVNNSVTRLYVDNPITVEGARLILRSAVANGVCQMVDIGSNYDDDEVKKMKVILEQRMKVIAEQHWKKQEVGGCAVRCNDRVLS